MSDGQTEAKRIEVNTNKRETQRRVANSLLDTIIWDFKLREICEKLAEEAIKQLEYENDK